MSYQHLTTFERARIETLYDIGYSTRAIAKQIGRSPSTVSRELRRNASRKELYCSEEAQDYYQERRKRCRPHGKWTKKTAQLIENRLDLTWSPEQIANRLFQGTLCFKTIYRWLYEGFIRRNLDVLRHKGKRRKPQETRGRFNVGTSITKRPKEIKTRETFGHWELDSVVSGRGKSKGCLATFVERKTRWYIALKMPNRTAISMEHAIRTLQECLPTDAFQTATVDRGKEFGCYPAIEAELGIDVYFAEPYSSWQRGSNENANGLLREFFPKATDLAKVQNQEVKQALFLINNRPRKCLDWQSAHEAFEHEMLHLV